jgi:hypothetical protein
MVGCSTTLINQRLSTLRLPSRLPPVAGHLWLAPQRGEEPCRAYLSELGCSIGQPYLKWEQIRSRMDGLGRPQRVTIDARSVSLSCAPPYHVQIEVRRTGKCGSNYAARIEILLPERPELCWATLDFPSRVRTPPRKATGRSEATFNLPLHQLLAQRASDSRRQPASWLGRPCSGKCPPQPKRQVARWPLR